VWPENWPAFEIFNLLTTQWNAGAGGLIGLRYEALYPLLDRAAADASDWDVLFEGVRATERGALDQIAKSKSN
jgi:hypothetical protein